MFIRSVGKGPTVWPHIYTGTGPAGGGPSLFFLKTPPKNLPFPPSASSLPFEEIFCRGIRYANRSEAEFSINLGAGSPEDWVFLARRGAKPVGNRSIFWSILLDLSSPGVEVRPFDRIGRARPGFENHLLRICDS